MKIVDGKIKLGKRDTRFGNFIVINEPEHYKIVAIGMHWSLRVTKVTQMGQLIENGLKDKENAEGFKNIISYLYTVSSTIGDMQSIGDVLTSLGNAAKRYSIKTGHPVTVYGSEGEMFAAALTALQGLNVWLSEDEVEKVKAFFAEHWKNNSEIYNPKELEKIAEDALKGEQEKEEFLSREKEQPKGN